MKSLFINILVGCTFDFTTEDLNGNKILLSSLKGKLIYVWIFGQHGVALLTRNALL